MISVVCFKWHAEAYRSKFTGQHVNILRNMVARHYPEPHRFICITDDAEGIDAGIEVVPLWHDHAHIPNPSFRGGPSCYRRLKVFSREFEQIAGPRFVCIDLDVVIMGDLRPLLNRTEPFIAWRDPGGIWPYNGSMVMMTAGARSQVWDEFDPITSPQEAHAARCKGSDQGWMSYKLRPGEATWRTEDGVLSYHLDLDKGKAEPPPGARVVMFHGKPDPWDDEAQVHRWIREHYR